MLPKTQKSTTNLLVHNQHVKYVICGLMTLVHHSQNAMCFRLINGKFNAEQLLEIIRETQP